MYIYINGANTQNDLNNSFLSINIFKLSCQRKKSRKIFLSGTYYFFYIFVLCLPLLFAPQGHGRRMIYTQIIIKKVSYAGKPA